MFKVSACSLTVILDTSKPNTSGALSGLVAWRSHLKCQQECDENGFVTHTSPHIFSVYAVLHLVEYCSGGLVPFCPETPSGQVSLKHGARKHKSLFLHTVGSLSQIRGMSIDEAIAQLSFNDKKGAKIMKEVRRCMFTCRYRFSCSYCFIYSSCFILPTSPIAPLHHKCHYMSQLFVNSIRFSRKLRRWRSRITM